MAATRFTRKELSTRNTKNDAVFVINNLVYNVTKFLDDHPGGHEVLLEVAGKDATEAFETIGHSSEAKTLMQQYRVGELVEEDKNEVRKRPVYLEEEPESFMSWRVKMMIGVCVVLALAYLLR